MILHYLSYIKIMILFLLGPLQLSTEEELKSIWKLNLYKIFKMQYFDKDVYLELQKLVPQNMILHQRG